jgi:Raf kinase inhibitor-like YbhB/YbcL family protein
MNFKKILLSVLLLSDLVNAGNFKLTSNDIEDGKHMPKAQEYVGFGCSGENLSPALSWSGAPGGTVAYALFAYDPDAPTGSGWWHWQIINIPKNISRLKTGAGDMNKGLTPKESIQLKNDYGAIGFGGACPPKGDGAHRYQFTIYALSKKLSIPEGASSALVGYMVKANSLSSATLEAFYKRN